MAVGLVRLVGRRGPAGCAGVHARDGGVQQRISNTATTLMMLPVAAAVPTGDRQARTKQTASDPAAARHRLRREHRRPRNAGGNPANVVFMGVYMEVTGGGIGFTEWMAMGIPSFSCCCR